MAQFNPPEIMKQHVVLLVFMQEVPIQRFSECLSVNLRIAQRIQIESDVSNTDYKGMAACKSLIDLNKTRTHEFLGEIQATTITASQSG